MAEENGISYELNRLEILDYFDFEKYGESFGYSYELLKNGYLVPNFDLKLDFYSQEEINERVSIILKEKAKKREEIEIEMEEV